MTKEKFHKKQIKYAKTIQDKLVNEAARQTMLRNEELNVQDLILEYIEQGLANRIKK